MENRITYVILMATIPSVLFVTYIYKKDKKEKEPIVQKIPPHSIYSVHEIKLSIV